MRALDWDRATFERDHDAALAFLGERCERLLTITVPLDLGRPRAGTKVQDANAAIAASAARHGALVLDLSDFGARNLVMADHVHPTAFGQIAIAERALDVLAARRDDREGAPVGADLLRDDAERPATRRSHVCVSASEGVDAGGLGSTPSCRNRWGT